MKHYLSRWFGCAALTLFTASMSGCNLTPVLVVNPGAVDFGSSTQASFRISNAGRATLTWTLTEVTRPNAESAWVANDVAWLSAESTSGSLQSGLTTVKLNADTATLGAGTTTNIGVRVDSNGGSVVLPLSITVEPTLSATPTIINLEATATSATFTVRNSGNQSASWSLLYLANPEQPQNAVALPFDGVVATPNPSSTAPGGESLVEVTWPGERDNFGLLLQSAAGTSVISIKFGGALDTLRVQPEVLSLYYNNQGGESGGTVEQVASTLSILNPTGSAVSWTLESENLTDSSKPAPIVLESNSGSTGAFAQSDVKVSVNNTVSSDSVLEGSGNYQLILRSGEQFILVPIVIEFRALPEIAVSDPPDDSQGRPEIVPIDLLDLGRESVQGEFWIANVGPKGSRLTFRVTHEDQGVAEPVIADVVPLQGTLSDTGDDFVYPGGNYRIDGIPVTVTVDRANLKEDVEFRTITIEAVEVTGNNVVTTLEPVEKKTVQVRIERAPLTIEGSINRSRPPYLMRFLFLLRDSEGDVIPVSEPDVLDKLSFFVAEDDFQIDLNETNFFVQGPEGIKTNLVLMLDYTGSMYYAGTDNATNPLQPGEAVEQVKNAARAFIKDLPEGYNLQLMYYNDRQQRNRLIHPFSSDRESLIAALDAFTLPESLFGVSTINDALIDALESLAAEDALDTLPFDEADLRAIIYITDGVDNASLNSTSEVSSVADTFRTRLYPVIYSAGSQTGIGEQLVLANDSGGHLYRAPEVKDLTRFLANESGIELSNEGSNADNFARIGVANEGGITLDINATVTEGADFIRAIQPTTTSVAAAASTILQVELDPSSVAIGETVVGQIEIATTPDNGSGFVTISATATNVSGDSTFEPENISISFRDPLGVSWFELSNQVFLTYVTPSQVGGDYNITVNYEVNETETISGSFQEDGIFAPGDVLAGQTTLLTSGIVQDPTAPDPADRTRAEIYVRADYVPRDVTSFRMRFVASAPADISDAARAALALAETRVELAPDGLLIADSEFESSWRLLSEGDGIYRMRTENSNDLLYGSFGNLLKITVNNLAPFVAAFGSGTRQPEFLFEMRVDNDEYYQPAGGGLPSRTKYFLYPGGPAFLEEGAGFPGNRLSVSLAKSSVAGPAPTVPKLVDPGIDDPEAAFPWDLDEDGISDFQDPEPLDEAIPSALVVPNSFEIAQGVNQFQLRVVNNRLDTFEWSVDLASLPSWVTSATVTSGSSPLAPGESATVTVVVDRAGFSDVVLAGTLNIVTDLFGTEAVDLTLVVPPAK